MQQYTVAIKNKTVKNTPTIFSAMYLARKYSYVVNVLICSLGHRNYPILYKNPHAMSNLYKFNTVMVIKLI